DQRRPRPTQCPARHRRTNQPICRTPSGVCRFRSVRAC
ncbi:MAG: hypothetical protein AVDCRST_MAG93-6339, partial [uncultured Chloroflexia bacterium]